MGHLKRVVNCSSVPQHFCFFIDGLDEIDGDQQPLIYLLQNICTEQHIKACVASRPLAVSEDAFFS